MKYVAHSKSVGGLRLSPLALVRLLQNGFPFEAMPVELFKDFEHCEKPIPQVSEADFVYNATLSVLRKGDTLYWPMMQNPELRSHPVLVRTLKDMGSTAVKEGCEWALRELPDDVPYTFYEQEDGSECVETPTEVGYVQGYVFEAKALNPTSQEGPQTQN